MEYRIQQRASMWVATKIEADTLEQALEKAQEKMNNGNYIELFDTFELSGDWWAEDANGNEPELPKDWR
jgi:hypothetical protein